MTIRALAIVFTFVLLLLVPPHTIQAETHQTVPSANFSFMSDLQNFLRVEDANRYSDFYSSAVISGGIHSTAAGLTGSPSSLVAYVGGYYITESGTITYPDASTCHIIAHKDITGDQGSYTRVSGTHYLINCGSLIPPSLPPAIPNINSVLLMTVTTTGGAIVAVSDLRPLGPQLGFDACRYTTLEAAVTALGTAPVPLIVSCHLRATINTTIPSTTTIRATRNAQLCPDIGVTITVSALIEGARQLFCSTGTVTFTSNVNPIVYDTWFPATEAGLQAAVTGLTSNQTLFCTRDLTLATGLTITNKSGIRITGRCALTLTNINGVTFIFELTGTIDRLEIDSLELIGVANTSAHQEGIGNFSGQTISNTKFHDIKIRDLNIGLECNADGGGTYNRCEIYRNNISNIVGTATGQGYGIVLSNVTAAKISDNRIDAAQRHSIYHGKSTQSGSIISHNIITNHRQNVATANRVGALVVVRSSGVLVDGNVITNHYDGCLDISHDTAQAASAADITVTNNSCLYRQNNVDDLYIGELAIPTNSTTSRIVVDGNTFKNDYAQTVNTSDVFIYNGTNVSYINNSHTRTGTTAATISYIIELGHNSAINTSTDFDNVIVKNNHITLTGSDLSSVQCVSIESDVTTGTSAVRVGPNDMTGCTLAYSLVAASTNPNLIIDYGTGFIPGYYTAADTTPTVKWGITFLSITNSGGVSITTFDDGVENQAVTLWFADANTTLVDGATLQLSGGANFVSSANDTLTIQKKGTVWYERGRSVN